MAAACIFCKIVKGTYRHPFSFTPSPLTSIALAIPANINHTGDIPSFKLFESERILAFLDIQPLSYGHAVCPSLSFIFPRLADLLPSIEISSLVINIYNASVARGPQTSRRQADGHSRRGISGDSGTSSLRFLIRVSCLGGFA